ncbi:MAG: membrane protein insertion efficiency factor YidD [Candidatus Acidiferrales bacterium]
MPAKNEAAAAPDGIGIAASAADKTDGQGVNYICDHRHMNSSATKPRSISKWVLLAFVQFYKVFFSPFLGGACKFYPSCSNYAQEAIELHGARRGAWLALKRLGRCRPFTQGGFDPVPDAEDLDAEWLRSGGGHSAVVESKEHAQ